MDELQQKWREEFRAIIDCKNAFIKNAARLLMKREKELAHPKRKEPER